MKRICKQCGKEFELSESEMSFYRKKNLDYPKRCAECRALNRAEKNKAAAEQLFESPVIDRQIVVQAKPAKKTLKAVFAVAIVLAAAIAVACFLIQWLVGDQSDNTTAVIETGTIAENTTATAESTTATEEKTEPEETQLYSETKVLNTTFDPNSEYSLSEPVTYTFRNDDLLNQHYEKHGIDMGFGSAEEYEMAASAVVTNPDALHKIETEDGDDVYYLEDTNEFVVVSTDGFLRTYFYPNDGIDYFNRQ